MVSCAICGCSKTPTNMTKGITFHKFPKNEQKREAWLKAINRSDWQPGSHSLLCSKHFTEDSFDRTSNLRIRLLPKAVPTIQVDRLEPADAYETEMSTEMDLSDEHFIVEYVIDDTTDEPEEQESEDPTDLRIGITDEAFVPLKAMSEANKAIDKPTLCGLLIGEIKLVQKYEKYKGKLFGYTEGIGKNPLYEPKKMASKAVIFMVISLTGNWKIPVGLFFVHNPDIKYFADTIEETLRRLNEINIDIISVTLNCVSPHLSFALAEELGAEIDSSKPTSSFKAFFPHPSNGNIIHILYDLDIVLSFLKSYWATERTIGFKDKIIDYSMCLDVKKIQETDLQNYGYQQVFDWIIIRKRLSYDTESIGRTTADAMQYLKDLGHPDFIKSGPTIQFLKVLDLISQLSRANGQMEDTYSNLSESNEQDWKPLVLNIISYVGGLRSLSHDTPEHLSVFRTFTTGITVYFMSLLEIYHKYVKVTTSENTELLPLLLPSRFGLKHIMHTFLKNVSEDQKSTALSIFKSMKSFGESLHKTDDTL